MPVDPSNIPLGSPGPNRSFVDRIEELDVVNKKLKGGGIQGEQIKSGVLCFWGAFGMGKSWLLKEIEHKYSFSLRQSDASHPSITARLDLSQKAVLQLWRNNQIDCKLLIRELWEQLASQLGAEMPDFPRASPDEWAKAFIGQVTHWALEMCTPLILLDTVDDLIEADQTMFNWLETHLIEPLAITDRVLFIFTSRGEIRAWNCFQVRRRIDSRRLSAFDLKTAGEAVNAALPVSQILYQYSFGHPYSNEKLATNFEKILGLNLQNPEDFKRPIDRSIMQSVLKQVIAEVLSVLPEDLGKIAWTISVLRWVSVEPLRCLCKKTNLIPEDRGDAYYLDNLIGTFQAKHLIYWISEKNCYEMDLALRRLLAFGLQLNDPDMFSAAHQAAYEFYQDHLVRFPAYLARYVPEMAFHLATLLNLSTGSDLNQSFDTWWINFITQDQLPSPRRWSELNDAMQADEELKEILPEDIYQQIVESSQLHLK